MKKTVLVLSAAVALSVMTAPVALAQDTGPDTNACEKARIAEGEALKDLRAAEKDRDRYRDAAKDGVELTVTVGEVTFGTDKVAGVSDLERASIDSLKGQVARVARKHDDAVEKREDKCADPQPTPTPTPTPTPEPENDVDCDEVSASEAQRILDEDRNDPNNLDQDKDGIACEVDEILPDPADDNPVTINNNVATPTGGVATGGGPAWAFQ